MINGDAVFECDVALESIEMMSNYCDTVGQPFDGYSLIYYIYPSDLSILSISTKNTIHGLSGATK
jgi:hypothetical protein